MKKMGHQGSGRMQSIREFGGGRTAERPTRTLAQVRQLPPQLLDHRFLLAGPPSHLPPHRGLRPRDAPDQPAVLDVGRAAAVLLVADRGVRGRAARGHRVRAAQHRRQLDLVVAVVARLEGRPTRQGEPRCSGGSLQQTAGFVPTGHLPVIDRAVFRQRRSCSVVVVAGVLSGPRVTWACAAFPFGLTSLSRSWSSENLDSRHPVVLGLSGSGNRPRRPGDRAYRGADAPFPTPALWAIGLRVNRGKRFDSLGVCPTPPWAHVPSEDWTFGPGALPLWLPWSGCRASPSPDKGEHRDDGTAAADGHGGGRRVEAHDLAARGGGGYGGGDGGPDGGSGVRLSPVVYLCYRNSIWQLNLCREKGGGQEAGGKRVHLHPHLEARPEVS